MGNAESLVEESHEGGLLEYPVYTRPASWDDGGRVREVPPVLLSGDHAAIAAWRHEQRVARTVARRPDLAAPSAAVAGLADLEVRAAVPADAPELLVLQRACWMQEGRISGCWHIPPLEEDLDDVRAGLEAWTTWVARVPADGEAPGRLVGSVRGRVRPGDATVWETGRLMVAADLQGRGLGRALLELAESAAPDDGRGRTGSTPGGSARGTSAATGAPATGWCPARARSRGRSTSPSPAARALARVEVKPPRLLRR